MRNKEDSYFEQTNKVCDLNRIHRNRKNKIKYVRRKLHKKDAHHILYAILVNQLIVYNRQRKSIRIISCKMTFTISQIPY